MSKPQFSDGSLIDPTVPEENEDGLKHISKSRVKTFLTCPRKFYYTYWCGNRSPGTYHTEKGTQIHRAYEDFHLNLIEYVNDHTERPDTYAEVMGPWEDYAQWLEPHIRNFWQFEDTRWDAVVDYICDSGQLEESTLKDALNLWLPLGVEVEGHLDDPPAGELPWMGYADAVLHAASVPDVEADDGVVILDYKTGKVQDAKYRDKGIFLEGEFYGWLFEEDPEFEYEISAVAGYYPQADELVVSPYPDEARRETIVDAVESMHQPPDVENYPIKEQPLCHWGNGRCEFYNVCESTWGLSGGSGYHNKASNDPTVSRQMKAKYGAE
jgi:CRISPR/Cas system-associated exonuclease Cas4 (RecB family)